MLLRRFYSKKGLQFSLLVVLFIYLFSSLEINIGSGSTTDYYFSVPQETVEVTINLDGSVAIEYWISFQVELGGQAIDIVDIGFPNKHYRLDSIVADVDGNLITQIYKSEVIDIGVEIHLGEHAIIDSGTLHVRGNQPYMVFEDSEEANMASTEFGNTWWESQYTTGTTNLTTRMIFPTTVTNETYTKYHYSQPPDRTFYLPNGQKVYEWHVAAASPSQQYKYGVSFPKDGVKWFTGIPLTEEEMIIFALIIFGVLFGVVYVAVSVARRRRRLMDYIPPFVSVPTAGPRTNLRREEVAIILEKPVEVTISMIILTLMDKKLLKPFTEDQFPQQIRRSKPRLRKYERLVLGSLQDDFSMDEADVIKAIKSLVKSTQRKVKGYSYDRTVDYYNQLIRDSVNRIKSSYDSDFTPSPDDWFWAILDEEFLPEFEIKIRELGYYEDYNYAPWYYHHHYHRWHWVPRGRGFTTKVTQVSYPIPKGTSRGSSGRGGCACACAGCACACAGGGR